jgi:hypothetical protein
VRIRSGTALVFATTAAATACGGGASATDGGLEGIVMRGPIAPVCRIGTPCSKPAAKALLLFTRSGGAPVRARTDTHGRYRVSLAGGTYRVKVPRREGISVTPTRTTAVAGRTRRVDFDIDTGIR